MERTSAAAFVRVGGGAKAVTTAVSDQRAYAMNLTICTIRAGFLLSTPWLPYELVSAVQMKTDAARYNPTTRRCKITPCHAYRTLVCVWGWIGLAAVDALASRVFSRIVSFWAL